MNSTFSLIGSTRSTLQFFSSDDIHQSEDLKNALPLDQVRLHEKILNTTTIVANKFTQQHTCNKI